MATLPAIDTSTMSEQEIRALATKLLKEADALSTKEFESTINFLNDKLRVMGKTKKDAVLALCMLMKPAELVDTVEAITGARPQKSSKGAVADSQGHRPVPGVTYRLPDGRSWTKKPTGAANKDFVAHAQTTTWESMKAR